MASKKQICAACGFTGLGSPQRSSSGGASHEICPSCGFEPGYTDDDQDISPEQWGTEWRASGSKWFSKSIPAPRKKSAPKAAVEKSVRPTKKVRARSVKKRNR